MSQSSSDGLAPVGGGGTGLAPVGGAAAASAPQMAPPPQPPAAAAPFAPQAAPPSATSARPYVYSSGAASYDDAPTGGPNKILLGGIGALVAALAVVAFLMFRTPPPVPAPTGYAPFTSADNEWSVETPQGWSVSPMGKAAGDTTGTQSNGVVMASGNAKVEVTISTVAGLVGGQLLFGNEVVPEATSGSKASGIAKLQKKAVSNAWKGYTETLQKDCPNGMGGEYFPEGSKVFVPDVRLFEWTAASNKWGLGGKKHGYRASEAGGELIAAVVCECSERDWANLKPAFQHVLGSLHELKKPGSERGGHGGGGMSLPGMGGTRVPLGGL